MLAAADALPNMHAARLAAENFCLADKTPASPEAREAACELARILDKTTQRLRGMIADAGLAQGVQDVLGGSLP